MTIVEKLLIIQGFFEIIGMVQSLSNESDHSGCMALFYKK